MHITDKTKWQNLASRWSTISVPSKWITPLFWSMKPANLFSALGVTSVVSSLLTKQHARKMFEKQQCRCNHLQLANHATVKSALQVALKVGTTFCGIFMRKENKLKICFFPKWSILQFMVFKWKCWFPTGFEEILFSDKPITAWSSKPCTKFYTIIFAAIFSACSGDTSPVASKKHTKVPLEDHMASWEIRYNEREINGKIKLDEVFLASHAWVPEGTRKEAEDAPVFCSKNKHVDLSEAWHQLGYSTSYSKQSC